MISPASGSAAMIERARRGVAVSTAPFSLAIRPTLDRFRSRTAAAISSGDLRHQAMVTAWIGARLCFRSTCIWT